MIDWKKLLGSYMINWNKLLDNYWKKSLDSYIINWKKLLIFYKAEKELLDNYMMYCKVTSEILHNWKRTTV